MSDKSSSSSTSASSTRSSNNKSNNSNSQHARAAAAASARRAVPQMTRLGVQYTDEQGARAYERISTVNGHTFTVPPVSRFHSTSAANRFVAIAGDVNPLFTPERFDSVRAHLQTCDRRTRESVMQAMGVLYVERLSAHFTRARDFDAAELERCFYPRYAPTYAAALRAVGLRKPLVWRHAPFAHLENLSRLPLDRCNAQREVRLSFEEWYSLFWNFYHPFNVLAFLCTVTAQYMVYTREFVDGLADYLAARHASLLADDVAGRRAPILFVGPRIGKLGALLNATGKLPVPVVHTHAKPNTNPYMLLIPPEKQAAFAPTPVQTMSDTQALSKYEPRLVLSSDMTSNTDTTSLLRQHGCVREYVYVGMRDGYAEGHPWETWGHGRYSGNDDDDHASTTTSTSTTNVATMGAADGDGGGGASALEAVANRLARRRRGGGGGGASTLPPYRRDGFVRVGLPHLSRWLLHRHDDELLAGHGTVTAWVRAPVAPSWRTRLSWRMARLRPLY